MRQEHQVYQENRFVQAELMDQGSRDFNIPVLGGLHAQDIAGVVLIQSTRDLELDRWGGIERGKLIWERPIWMPALASGSARQKKRRRSSRSSGLPHSSFRLERDLLGEEKSHPMMSDHGKEVSISDHGRKVTDDTSLSQWRPLQEQKGARARRLPGRELLG